MTLIKCSDHKLAPAILVCRHLLEGTATEWCPVFSEDDENHDWICPDCGKLYPNIPVEDVRIVCLHCCRGLQKKAKVIHQPP